VAEVTTQATFEIAEIYRKLGQDIMKSERPKKLAAEQLDEYNSLLEEQAFPFEEQAISTHEINTKRVREDVYDDGVKKSFAALAELKPGRYGKTEMMSASLDALVPPAPPAALAPPPMATPATGSKESPAVPAGEATAATPAAPAYNIPKPPARASGEYSRALALMRSDPTQASLEMQLMTQTYPDLSGPYANLGILYRNANQLAESEGALQKATEKAPWDAASWTEYGVTLRQAGKFAEARTAYEKALAANPSYAPAHRNLGVLLDLYLDDSLTAQTEFETYKTLTGEDKPVSSWLAELRSRNKVAAPKTSTPAADAPAPDAPAPEAPPQGG
jgi:Flp pilus assembly protein TadD